MPASNQIEAGTPYDNFMKINWSLVFALTISFVTAGVILFMLFKPRRQLRLKPVLGPVGFAQLPANSLG